MTITMDKLFKGYTIREIEEILLKSAIEDLKKRKIMPSMMPHKKNIRHQHRVKM